jgi:hypothetical protein
MFPHLVPSCDADIDLTLTNKRRNIGGRQENESNGEVFDEGNVKTVLAPELDVGTFEQVKGGLVESSL